MPFLIFSQEQLHRYSENLMGTEFNIVLYGDAEETEKSARIAFSEIERVNQIFSNYISDSELSVINRTKGWQVVSTEMAELLAFSELLNNYSAGAFDIKIGKAIDAWKGAIKEEQLLSEQDIKRLKKKSPWINFKENEGNYFLKLGKHAKLDFGGIAKGYAVDKAFEALVEQKAIYCLIDGGGDIRMGQKPPNSNGWKIGLYDNEGEIILLENCAIASSGHDYQFMEIGGSIYMHIVNPATMDAKSQKRGVTIISDNCRSADALATAFSVNPYQPALRKHFRFQARIKEGVYYIIKDF